MSCTLSLKTGKTLWLTEVGVCEMLGCVCLGVTTSERIQSLIYACQECEVLCVRQWKLFERMERWNSFSVA